MVITVANSFAGSPEPKAEIASLPKTAVAIAKGDVLEYVHATDNFRTAAANAVTTRFAVAVKAATAAATTVEAVTKGEVSVIAGAAIAPGAFVKVDATAGQVAEAVMTGTPDAFSSIVGTYIGRAAANERNGVAVTAAADGDVIIIDVNRRST